jgi:hypothetical protein
MPMFGDRVFDEGLNSLNAEGETLHIVSSEPATYAAVAGVSLGTKASPTISVAADRGGGGREVTVSAITDGSVSADGTATGYAIVDDSNSRLLAAGDLSSSQAVTNGNTFTLTQFTIGIPDPA